MPPFASVSVIVLVIFCLIRLFQQATVRPGSTFSTSAFTQAYGFCWIAGNNRISKSHLTATARNAGSDVSNSSTSTICSLETSFTADRP